MYCLATCASCAAFTVPSSRLSALARSPRAGGSAEERRTQPPPVPEDRWARGWRGAPGVRAWRS
eukprot:scaffold2580_cov388-Prasinococcus_capsulatus_cf.AAC.13